MAMQGKLNLFIKKKMDGFFLDWIEVLHSVNPCLFKGGLGFLKNHRRGDQDFLVKMGGGLSIEGSRGISTAFH